MFVVHASHFAQMIGGSFIVHVTNQRITGVCGYGQYAALIEQRYSLF